MCPNVRRLLLMMMLMMLPAAASLAIVGAPRCPCRRMDRWKMIGSPPWPLMSHTFVFNNMCSASAVSSAAYTVSKSLTASNNLDDFSPSGAVVQPSGESASRAAPASAPAQSSALGWLRSFECRHDARDTRALTLFHPGRVLSTTASSELHAGYSAYLIQKIAHAAHVPRSDVLPIMITGGSTIITITFQTATQQAALQAATSFEAAVANSQNSSSFLSAST